MVSTQYGIAWVVNMICQVLMWTLIIRSVLSWFVASGTNSNSGLASFYNILTKITEPLVIPFRALLTKLNFNISGLDLAPLLAFFTIMLIRKLLISLIYIF